MAAFDVVNRTALSGVTLSVVDFQKARLPEQKPPRDGFDPRDYRTPDKPISVWMAYFNMLRTAFGAGVLGLPLATSQAGIIVGPLMILATGGLIFNSHVTLLWCLNEISRQLKISYTPYRYGFKIALLNGPPIFQCLAIIGPALIGGLMILSQLGICTVFVIFTADSLRDMMDWSDSETAMLSLLVPYLILEFFMKNLKIVSYISMLGNFLNIAGLVLTFYQVFRHPTNDMILSATEALPLVFAFGTCLFNLSAVGVVLSLERALKEPRWMTRNFGVLQVGILIPTLIGAVFGALGYWSFGTMEENILRALPFDDLSAMFAIGLYLIAIAFAYPIQCYPAIQIIMDILQHFTKSVQFAEGTIKTTEYIVRPCFVCASFLVCYLAPFQGPFVAFVGNLCTTQLCLIFPAMMELCILYPDFGMFKIHLIKNILLISLGILQFTMGVYLCGKLLYVRTQYVSSAQVREFL